MRPAFVVLGLMGESESGKDFSAAWIIQHQGYVRVGFADVIKRFVKTVFEFSDEALWGEPKFRNEEVVPCNPDDRPIPSDLVGAQWDRAQENLKANITDFTNSLPLSLEERADYRDFLKRWFWECENVSERKHISPRLTLQLLGTEYGREFKGRIWSDYIFRKVIPGIKGGYPYGASSGIATDPRTRKTPPNGVVITDVRFKGEIEHIQEEDGYVIKIVRLAHKDKENEAEKAGITGHASEAEQRDIPDEAYDVVLEMGEGAENVYPRLERMFEEKEWELQQSQSRRDSSTELDPNAKEPTGDTPKS